MRGPKRASKIRKLFNLSKGDDVRKYVNTYRHVKEKDGKTHSKAPKIQRLVTPTMLQRKRRRRAIKRERISKVLRHTRQQQLSGRCGNLACCSFCGPGAAESCCSSFLCS